MDPTLNFDSSLLIYRHIKKHEQQQAIDMWCSIFKTNADLEGRYFSSDTSPDYQEGDTLGAWYKDKLVSTVHIQRLILQSSDKNHKYICGGISNVATLPEYRRQGLSRHLLKFAISKMEMNNEFDISMLGTGIPSHYAPLGWEHVAQPAEVMINSKTITSVSIDVKWRSASAILSNDVENLLQIYSNNPRIYQIDRSPSTRFQHWVKWEWESNEAIICMYEDEQEQGYVVIDNPDSEENIRVLEWRASNLNLEQKLLSLAAIEIRRRHESTKLVHLFALPQYMTIDQLMKWVGPVQNSFNSDIMMRNIRLPNDVYEQIKAAYVDGRAIVWSGDYF